MNNLKFDTIFEGAMKCLKNAQDLCDEAEILHKHDKFARSFALSHFAREEFGKCFMLFRALVDVASGQKVDWKKLNRRFRDHKQKLVNDCVISASMFGSELKAHGLPLEDVFSGINFKNDRKNNCLYTDWSDGSFTLPSDMITEDQSERNLSLAIYRIAKLTPQLVRLQDLKNVSQQELKEKYPKDIPENLDDLLNALSNSEQT